MHKDDVKKMLLFVEYGRSGTTLLNRCLGCLQDVIILSEVHQERNEVKKQAKEWYDINLSSDDFMESVVELYNHCLQHNKILILRDWTYIDFCPLKEQRATPPNRMTTYDLLKEKIPIKTFTLTRDAIDMWISSHCPPTEYYFEQYEKYLESILANKVKVFKYEDLCQHTEDTIKNICNYCNITFSDAYLNYNDFWKVNGDVQRMTGSRGLWQKKIQLFPRKQISPEKIMELNECKRAQRVNKLLEYPEEYTSRELEKLSFSTKIKNYCSRLSYLIRRHNIARFLRKYVFRIST